MGAVFQRVEIVNKKGLHARASNAFAELAEKFDVSVHVEHNGEVVNGTHRMELMMLVAHKGCEIEIRVDGPEAETALAALVDLVKDGFGELKTDENESEIFPDA